MVFDTVTAHPSPDQPTHAELGRLLRVVAHASALPLEIERRRRLLDELIDLLGCEGAAWAAGRGDGQTSRPLAYSIIDRGFAKADRTLLYEMCNHAEWNRLVELPTAPHVRPQYSFTRRMACPDAHWHASVLHTHFMAKMRLSDFVGTVRIDRPREFVSWLFFRKTGRTQFTSREAALIDCVFASVPWLRTGVTDFGQQYPAPIGGPAHASRAAHPRRPAPGGSMEKLTSRQRQVLQLLLGGSSRKEIAAAIDRSEHTVHDHVKQLYRHFDVTSRGELGALFMAPSPADANASPDRDASTDRDVMADLHESDFSAYHASAYHASAYHAPRPDDADSGHGNGQGEAAGTVSSERLPGYAEPLRVAGVGEVSAIGPVRPPTEPIFGPSPGPVASTPQRDGLPKKANAYAMPNTSPVNPKPPTVRLERNKPSK